MAHYKAYQKAEQKIAEARRLGVREFYLWNMQLTELPESLEQLKGLYSLNLGGNQLTTLPEWLGNLTQLQLLDLSSNRLEALPVGLFNLTQLLSLDLSDNQLVTLPELLGNLAQLQSLNLSKNNLTILPEWIGKLTNLGFLSLAENHLTFLPESLKKLTYLRQLGLWSNQLTYLPEFIGTFKHLNNLEINANQITDLPLWIGDLQSLGTLVIGGPKGGSEFKRIPDSIGKLTSLKKLWALNCKLTDLPTSLAQLDLEELNLDGNPLNPELTAVYKQGLGAIKVYLRAKAAAQITLNEAKLILVGEGEVGKTCLMDALQGVPWQKHDTTHGIEIRSVQVTTPDSDREITLNGWDFGGQRVYRPTHQLFFSSPAVYLVVWKPREGPQQGFVKEWIKLIKHREPDAKILVVATHGGPQQRQPDIDQQELWDLFGKDTVIDYFHVESKPDENGERRGIEELKQAIAHIATNLPEMGRSVPKSFQEAREALKKTSAAYLPLERVLDICREHQMDDEITRLFVTISHRLGHLIHYQHDLTLRDIVILKPDWLATAISFILDDELTRKAFGLVRFSHLNQLWDDPNRAVAFRYPSVLHPVFLRLMERFDLSYRVAGLSPNDDTNPASLIAQLVPDTHPGAHLEKVWLSFLAAGDIQQMQICRIVDAKGQSATAEGLFYLLIVRLHKFSLGRVNYHDSVHWQRGLVVDADYNGRALLEYKGTDVHITVRAPYPVNFLAMLTSEVKYLVESIWEGLQCNVMVPCLNPEPCIGLFEVGKLIENKKRGRPEQPCPICNEWQNIDRLLLNAPAAQPVAAQLLFDEFSEVKRQLTEVRHLIVDYGDKSLGRFDRLDDRTRHILSRIDETYDTLLQALTDEAKEGPRLFSLVPVNRSKFNPKQWVSSKFRLILWCEHSRLPLPMLNSKDSKQGVYEFDLTYDWFKKAAPLLKFITGTLSLALPVASAGVKLAIDEVMYKSLENYLDFGKEVIEATLDGSEKMMGWLDDGTSTDLEHGKQVRAHGAILRELHALLKAKDPGFGGLVRVMNKRQEFLWVHPQFEKEY